MFIVFYLWYKWKNMSIKHGMFVKRISVYFLYPIDQYLVDIFWCMLAFLYEYIGVYRPVALHIWFTTEHMKIRTYTNTDSDTHTYICTHNHSLDSLIEGTYIYDWYYMHVKLLAYMNITEWSSYWYTAFHQINDPISKRFTVHTSD